MRVLVISNSEWDDSASFGNTFTNLFAGVEDLCLANVFCREGTPDTKTCSRFLKISERTILKGEPAVAVSAERKVEQGASGATSFFKKHRWTIFFWARELIWATNRWKCKALDDFVRDFAPDLILLMIYPYSYINKLALYISKMFNVPMVTHVSDDDYSLRQRSWSPLYWLNRLYQRKWIKRAVENSRALYCMTEMQMEEYGRYFTTPCKLLVKGVDTGSEPAPRVSESVKRFFYAGNLGDGRWKSLLSVARALSGLNRDGVVATLDIFTPTPLSEGAKRAFSACRGTTLSGKIPYGEVCRRQESSDVLVHVESFVKKYALRVRHSFSTKIVDYLARRRCVLAVGPSFVASMDYLMRKDCAVTATSEAEISARLNDLISRPGMIEEYADKGYECGKRDFDLSKIRKAFIDDLGRVIDESSAN